MTVGYGPFNVMYGCEARKDCEGVHFLLHIERYALLSGLQFRDTGSAAWGLELAW